jgi:predicted nucleotidyltransferase
MRYTLRMLRKLGRHALFPRTRQQILAATLLQPQRWWYLSDLARHLGVSPSSLQRELSRLIAAGVLEQRREGGRVYFRPDANCPVLEELTGIAVKTTGLVDVLRDALRPYRDRILAAFVFGSVARGDVRSTSDVDLLVVGQTGLADLAPALRKIERRIGRAVNPTVYTPRELADKLAKRHHFVSTVWDSPKLMIMGTEHDLEAIGGQRHGQAAQDQQARARRPESRRRPRPG